MFEGWDSPSGERADEAGGGEEGLHLAPTHPHTAQPAQVFSQEGR
jgi:hypothetical protein